MGNRASPEMADKGGCYYLHLKGDKTKDEFSKSGFSNVKINPGVVVVVVVVF